MVSVSYQGRLCLKKIIIILAIFVILFSLIGCSKKHLVKNDKRYDRVIPESNVKFGIDVLLEKKLRFLKGKRVGLITNKSGITKDLVSTIEALHGESSVNLVCLFSPEHGIRGDKKAGEYVDSYTDGETGLPVYSLYGRNKKPTEDMMKQIDVLLFDIQDIGVRTYTYVYTMSYGMEAAAEYNKEFYVLDRPNPIGGIKVEGNILDTKYKSFIGRYPVAFRHGMTAGELARMFNKEFEINCNLTVIETEGWQRSMYYDQTGLPWIAPSPHIPHPETALYYAASGFIGELGTLAEGVGTTTPFEVVGAPKINPFLLASTLNNKNLPGVFFYPVYFIPFYHNFKDMECGGVKIFITERNEFNPFRTGLYILESIKKLYPDYDIFSKDLRMFHLATGTDKVINSLRKNIDPEEIISSFDERLKIFKQKRKMYLIY